MKDYTESEVLRLLKKKRDVQNSGKSITVYLSPEVGNGTWGKVEFLTNHCGYTWRIGERSR